MLGGEANRNQFSSSAGEVPTDYGSATGGATGDMMQRVSRGLRTGDFQAGNPYRR